MADRYDYAEVIATRSDVWRDRATCRDSSPEVVTMFTCTEDEKFEQGGVVVTGAVVQGYLLEAYCAGCPVQWECAHAGLVEEADAGDRSTGVWAMMRSDRRWLSKQDDALGIIDLAYLNGTPVQEAVAEERANRV